MRPSSSHKLLDYEVGEVTAAATFYLAEIYANFSKALMESERPEDLAHWNWKQYELGHRGAGLSLRGEGHCNA